MLGKINERIQELDSNQRRILEAWLEGIACLDAVKQPVCQSDEKWATLDNFDKSLIRVKEFQLEGMECALRKPVPNVEYIVAAGLDNLRYMKHQFCMEHGRQISIAKMECRRRTAVAGITGFLGVLFGWRNTTVAVVTGVAFGTCAYSYRSESTSILREFVHRAKTFRDVEEAWARSLPRV